MSATGLSCARLLEAREAFISSSARRLGAMLVLAAGLFGVACAQDEPPPHILLVSSDTLRVDHLSYAGYGRDTSPNIDAFAAESLVFSQAVTVVPKTGPSFTTHLSGLHPRQHGVSANRFRIPDDVTMLAELLRSAGYRTAAFVSNPVLASEKGYARGFDQFRMFAHGAKIEAVQQAFIEWAEGEWKRPTFAWIHYIEPHGPYAPPVEFRARYVDDELYRTDRRRLPLEYERLEGWPAAYVLGAVPHYQRLGNKDRVAFYVSQYDAEIRNMDAVFGELLDYLKKRGLYHSAAILFSSDHGEGMGENDYWFEHGWFANDPGLRVPLILKRPDGIGAGRRIAEQVSNLDTMPTILSLAGVELPPGRHGRDLLSEDRDAGPLLIENSSTYPERYLGTRTPELKYLRETVGGAEFLFDLEADPGETHNLFDDGESALGSAARATFEALLEAWSDPDRGPPVAIDALDERTRRQLESLGYTR